MLLDDFLPRWDFREQHRTMVRAEASRVFPALMGMDLRQAPLSRLLFFLRELPWRLSKRDFIAPGLGHTLEDLLRLGFIDLGRLEGQELVLGLAAKPWRLNPEILRLNPAEFVALERPGFVKVAANFRVEPQGGRLTLLTTETRVLCLGDRARRAFGIYWALIRPGSGLIRREMLLLAKKAAESRG